METWQAINTTTWRVNDNLTIKNIASYTEFRETARFSIQGDNFLDPITGRTAFYNIQLNNTPGYNNSSQNTYTEELQLIGTAAQMSGASAVSALGHLGGAVAGLLVSLIWKARAREIEPACA